MQFSRQLEWGIRQCAERGLVIKFFSAPVGIAVEVTDGSTTVRESGVTPDGAWKNAREDVQVRWGI
jgi:hypothetical protein